MRLLRRSTPRNDRKSRKSKISYCSPDKAKPFVRGGRKATGLGFSKTAELPKEANFRQFGFFIFTLNPLPTGGRKLTRHGPCVSRGGIL